MYRIVYEKQAVKDIPRLKAAKLDKKAQALIEILRNNPTQPPCEALVGRINFEFKINLQKRRNSLNFNYHTKVKEVRHDRKRSD